MKRALFKCLSGLSLAAWLLACTAAYSQTVTYSFRQGADIPELGVTSYSGASNLTLISGTNVNRNYGSSNSIWVGNSAGAERKGLIRFDLSSLQGNIDGIESVTLSFRFMAQSGSNSKEIPVHLYALTMANDGWVQGTASGAVEAGSSSWNYRVTAGGGGSAERWAGDIGASSITGGLSVAGVDYIATVIDGTKIVQGSPTSGAGTIYSWTLPVELIQQWIQGDNPGLLIQAAAFGDLENNDYFRFASSSHGTENWRPTLAITYSTIPEPVSVLSIFSVVVLVSVVYMRRRKQAE